MLDDGWQRHGEGLGELAHRALAAAQPDQHGAAGGIGQRAEDCVEPAYLIVNHKVQCARELRTCQAAGKTDGRARLSAPRCLELTAPFLNRRLDRPTSNVIHYLVGTAYLHLGNFGESIRHPQMAMVSASRI